MEYNQIDHFHCWTKESPPCGQKIKHFECCLCQLPHPDILSVRQSDREALKAEIENLTLQIDIEEYLPKVRAWKGGYDVPFDDGYTQSKKDVLAILDKKK